MRLVTRAQLGWPASAAPLQATTLGTKVHYEGTAVSTRLLADHDACITQWKAIRASHLANTTENYSDVAYNYGACPHGYLLEGRGLGRRTGANGNQELNRGHYAICGLLGDSGLTEPTPEMLSAIRDGIDLLRQHGAGLEIRGHRDGYATSCPGAPLYAWVQKGAPRPVTTIPEDDMPLSADEWKRLSELLDKKNKALLDTRLPSVVDADRTVMVRDHIRGGERYATARQLTAQVAALTAIVGQLAAGGPLSAAELTAAAEAGADAALDKLGEALTD